MVHSQELSAATFAPIWSHVKTKATTTSKKSIKLKKMFSRYMDKDTFPQHMAIRPTVSEKNAAYRLTTTDGGDLRKDNSSNMQFHKAEL